MYTDKKARKTVMVLGCPRSGTSLLSGLLSKLGVNMGNNLRRPDKYNPEGYFEDIELLAINERLFTRAGGVTWGMIIPTKEALRRVFEEDKEEIKRAIKKRNENKIWGFKVGANLTAENWLSYLKNPTVLIIFRNPLSVINSMKETKGISLRVASFVLINHLKSILHFCNKYEKKIPINFYEFEKIKANPRRTVLKLVQILEIPITKEKIEEAIAFVK